MIGLNERVPSRRQDELLPSRGSEIHNGSTSSQKQYIPPVVKIEGNAQDETRSPLTTTPCTYLTRESEVFANVFSDDTVHHHPPALREIEEDLSSASSLPYTQNDQSVLGNSGSFSAAGVFRPDYVSAWAEAEYDRLKKKFALVSICISVAQLTVLMLQLTVCGVAPLDVNPIVGPYPDAFSEWGGKNPYLLVQGLEVWRLVTPAFLHVGVLHLLVNAAVQLETCAYFEREWGSIRYFLIYLISEVGAVGVSSIVEPDTIAVGSSAALMGLFGAKLAQLLVLSCCHLNEEKGDFSLNPSQAVGMMFMFLLIALLSAISYVEWSAHVGGLATGFICGFLFLSGSLRSRFLHCSLVLLALVAIVCGFTVMMYYLFTQVESDEDLGNVCQYFRRLYSEGYNCECFWH